MEEMSTMDMILGGCAVCMFVACVWEALIMAGRDR